MLTVNADYEKVNSAGGTAIAIGNFDGIHKGHQKMLKTLKSVAYELGVPSVVYTFLEHPVNLLCKEKFKGVIYTNEKKEKLISGIGIHTLFFEDFLKVSNLTPEEFVQEILVDKFKISAAVIGENGKFGKGGAGDAEVLKELGEKYGFSVHIVSSLMIDNEVCSSTYIRNKITSGEVDVAENFLGRPYSVAGVVVGDKHLGKSYGYPTANLIPDECVIKLKRGVYGTNVKVGEKSYKAITNVGTTSFDDEKTERIESHILDFNENLYEKTIEVEFLYYMRDFKSFLSTDELKIQLDEDKKMRKLGGK